MTFVIVVVTVIFTYVLIRFRRKKGDDSIPEQVEGSMKLEITWTVIPIILLLIIIVPMVSQIFFFADADPSAEEIEKEDALKIEVIAHQYWWEFNYPDLGVSTASDLYIPTDTKVYADITSDDVIHSFWADALFGKMDANPGLTNRMFFSADEPGIHYGQCAELCGPSHALMDFRVVAVSPEKFDNWVESMKEGEDKPTTEVAQAGRELFADNCLSCHAVGDREGGGTVGPNLTGYGDRTTIAGILDFNDENLHDWIKDAPSIKSEDIEMPAFDHLSDDEIDAIAEYLKQQKTGVEHPVNKVGVQSP